MTRAQRNARTLSAPLRRFGPPPLAFLLPAAFALQGVASTAALAGQGAELPPPARTAAASADTFHLPGVAVTATGEATPRVLLPQAVTVLEGEDLRRQGVIFLADALAQVPGVQVVRTGSLGGTTSVFLRGGNSDFVRVMLDGVPLNEPGGRFDFGNFTVQNVERIEVVRGPSSVLYGSDAVSGVIQIFTRRAEGKVGGEAGGAGGESSAAAAGGAPEAGPAPSSVVSAAFQGGSLGTWSGEFSARGASERANWTLGLGRTDSDGFYEVNNRFTSLVGSGRLELAPDTRTRLALALRVHESRYQFPTDGNGAIVDLNQFNFDEGVTLSLEANRALATGLTGRLLVRAGQAERGFDNAPDSPADTLGFGFAGERLGTTLRRGADARLRWRSGGGFGALTATGGVDWEVERERLQSRTLSNFGAGTTVSSSAFREDRWNLAGYGQLEVDGPAGTRWTAGARTDRNEVFGSFLTAQAGVVLPLPGFGRLRAHAGSAYKAPTFVQQFASTPFERGNPDLEPENSRSVEAGWDGGFFANRLVLGVGVFRQSFEDLIVYENRGTAAPTYYNESEARSAGLEASAMVRGPGGIEAGAEFTRVNARVVTEDPDRLIEGEAPRLLRRPARQLTGRLRAPLLGGPEGSVVGLALTGVGSRIDNDFSTFPSTRVTLPSYTTFDLDVQVPVQSFLLTLRMENLANTEYLSVVGFPGKGRMAFVGLRWNP